jgi:hypothetical protein
VHLRQTPAEQETVLLTISRVNGLHLLRRAHSALADMNQVPTEVTDAIRDGKPLPDARLDALSTFTASLVESRGLPTTAEVEGVPPATRMLSPARTLASRNVAAWGVREPSSTRSPSRAALSVNLRMLTAVNKTTAR